jgi:hypothetical protein
VTTTEHLHLVREKRPTVQFDEPATYQVTEVWCPDCGKPVHLIHLELPPMDPKPKPGRP